MDLEQRDSGLVVPMHQERTEPPPDAFGPLELTDEGDRERAKAALQELWSVTLLEYPPPFPSDVCKVTLAARLYAWQCLAHMLLGDDFECDILT